MPDKITAINSFKTSDPELLKKSVTEKIAKLISSEAQKQPSAQLSC